MREYREILRKNPGKYYLWEELASIAKDKNLRISALCKAIVMQPKDEFLVNVRLSLADELIEKGLFAEALCELDRYALTCERNSWPKKRAYNELVSRIPEGTQPAKDNSSFYEAHTAAYKEFIYSDIPWTPMAIAAIFSKVGKNGKQEEMAKLISRDGRILTIRVKCLLGISQPKVGLCLDVKLKRKDGWNEAILTRLSEVSLDEIVSEEVGVVDNVNEVKRLFHCVLENDKDVTVYFKDTALRPVVGDVMMVRSYRDVNREGVARYRAIDIRIDNSIRTSLLREFEGMAEVKTGTTRNKYCFIDGVYIPGHLLKGLGEWIQAKGKAIKTKRGWTAVALYSTKTLCRIDHC